MKNEGPPKPPNFPHLYLFKEVGVKTLEKKRREGLCKHWGCRNFARYGGRDCETCKTRKRRIDHPRRYAFEQVKRSADLRGIPFELTFEQFCQFDAQTGYVASKGQEAESLTIDRIDAAQGYTVGNIRALTHAENTKRKVEGMVDPIEPIAKALAMTAKDSNWHKFKKLAVEVLEQVEILQVQQEGGFTPDDLGEEDDNCPF